MVKSTRKHSVTKEMVIEDVKRLYKATEEEGKSYPSLKLAFLDKSYPYVTDKYVRKFFGSCIEMSKELDLPIKVTSTKMYRCAHCGKEVIKWISEVTNGPTTNVFCNRSCAATYNNTHKTKGTRVSKLERYLQEVLPLRHNIEFKFNSKEEINSELDIYIPSLKLAFELNGIFHYEPVYGQDKLDKIINNDKLKFKACHEAGISLCVIDTTSQKKFTAESSSVFVVLIEQIIMEALEVVETSSVPSQGTILSS